MAKDKTTVHRHTSIYNFELSTKEINNQMNICADDEAMNQLMT